MDIATTLAEVASRLYQEMLDDRPWLSARDALNNFRGYTNTQSWCELFGYGLYHGDLLARPSRRQNSKCTPKPSRRFGRTRPAARSDTVAHCGSE